jgi:hypothetical protein
MRSNATQQEAAAAAACSHRLLIRTDMYQLYLIEQLL